MTFLRSSTIAQIYEEMLYLLATMDHIPNNGYQLTVRETL